MAPGLYFSFQDRAAEAAADLFLRGHVPPSLLRQQQHQPLGTVFLLYGEQVRTKDGGLGARGRNSFKSLHGVCWKWGTIGLVTSDIQGLFFYFVPVSCTPH